MQDFPHHYRTSAFGSHDSNVDHDTSVNLGGTNPFRLVDQNAGSAGVQYSCSFNTAGCHQSGIIGPATGPFFFVCD